MRCAVCACVLVLVLIRSVCTHDSLLSLLFPFSFPLLSLPLFRYLFHSEVRLKLHYRREGLAFQVREEREREGKRDRWRDRWREREMEREVREERQRETEGDRRERNDPNMHTLKMAET